MNVDYERLLSRHFTPEQLAEFAYYGWVTVIGGKTGRKYVLAPGLSPLVLNDRGIISHELCVYARFPMEPQSDHYIIGLSSVISFKYSIEKNEHAFLYAARERAIQYRRSLHKEKPKLIRLIREESSCAK